mmetsp:Transcript_46375/g.93620  ORF Transcript_46375/g.93620 Transcript_46375/m.93620 type:complete len:120 (-) Transcript_46375:69-428(-)
MSMPLELHRVAEKSSHVRRCSSPASSPTSTTSGARRPSTPPVKMPDAPQYVQQMDLDYLVTMHQLESKEWAMWELLTSHGIKVQSPVNDPALFSMASPSLPCLQGYADSDEMGMFDFDL